MEFQYTQPYGGDVLPNQWLPYLSHLIGQPNVIYCEIGSCEGMSVISVLQKILTHPTARAICVDPFETNPHFMNGQSIGNYYARFIHNTRPWRDQIRIIKKFSGDAYGDLLFYLDAKSVDLAFVDGSHDDPDPYNDAELLHGFLKVGGFMVFDDAAWDGVRNCIDRFLQAHMHEYVVVATWETQKMIRRVA